MYNFFEDYIYMERGGCKSKNKINTFSMVMYVEVWVCLIPKKKKSMSMPLEFG